MDGLEHRYESLMHVSEAILAHRDMSSLLNACSQFLHSVIEFEYFDIVLFDPDKGQFSAVFAGKSPTFLDLVPLPDIHMEEGPGWLVLATQRPLRCSIEELRLKYPKVAALRNPDQVRSTCMVPLTTVQRQLGVMEFLSVRPNAYSEEDAQFLQQVASQVAVAIDNALNYQAIRVERDHLSALLTSANAISSKRNTEEMLKSVLPAITEVFRSEHVCFLILDAKLDCFRVYMIDGGHLNSLEETCPHDASPWGQAFAEQKRQLVGKVDVDSIVTSYPEITAKLKLDRDPYCCVPLIAHNKCIGVLILSHEQEDAFSNDHLGILDGISDQLALGIENSLAYQEISELKDRLASENLYLEEEIKTNHNFEEIIGESDALQELLAQVRMVADSDCTVLILGETGTGKELIARAIHHLSTRRDRPLIKLNCAAIPLGLLESELFGHEKGAFTGAVAQRIGRLELAHQGTLFLDEVAEISLELQPKLLRAIQEREIERLGGARVIHVDVRIIAATNRDLKQMVADHQFRSDLFYRLNVFPLRVPPLRERQADIPLLVRHFIQKHTRRIKREIESIPSKTMQMLCDYPWPGNIRELENLIERSVILSKGSVLNVPTCELSGFANSNQSGSNDGIEMLETLLTRRPRTTERELIVRTLRETRGVVSGPNGAAAKLGLKRSTLVSRIKRLKLQRISAEAEFSRDDASTSPYC